MDTTTAREGEQMTEREAEHVRADGAAGEPAAVDPPAPPAADEGMTAPAGRNSGCRSDRPGWAGAHSHGAVRPRRRAVGQGRPPRRWC